LDVNLVHTGSAAILLDRLEGTMHSCHINSSRKGMDFQAYSHESLLDVPGICGAITNHHSWLFPQGRCLFRRPVLSEQDRPTRTGVHQKGNIPSLWDNIHEGRE
jgi:hypothetical protein